MESKSTSTDQNMSEGEDGGEPLTTSTRVVDRLEDNDEFSPMRVLNGFVGRANQVTAGGKNVSEYEDNLQFPDDDPVVQVAFEADLDGRITGWQDHTDRLNDYLDEFAEEWNVTVNTYHYPRSRLKEIPDPVIET